MESLANLSGYQKPSVLGSCRPLNSIMRQKWQLSNGNQPDTSRQTEMHHNSADLFHLQSHNIQAEDLLDPPGTLFVSPCRTEDLLKVVRQTTEQERETAEVGNNGNPPPGPVYIFAAR